jgi:malonyl CoA-acyl carrier protein transacylase
VREGLGVELVDGVDLAGVRGALFQVLVAETTIRRVEVRPTEENMQRVVEEAGVSGVSIS